MKLITLGTSHGDPGQKRFCSALLTQSLSKLGLKPPYVTRVLGLNNLAPDIVEAIVNGAEPDGLSIAQIMKNIPEDWNEQRRLFGFPER